MTKISNLPAVTDLLTTDEFALARAGESKKIDAQYFIPWTKLIEEDGSSVANFTQTSGTWTTDGTVISHTGVGGTWTHMYHSTQIPSQAVAECEVFFDSTGAANADQRFGFAFSSTASNDGVWGGLKCASNTPASNGTYYGERWRVAGYAGPARTFAMDTWLAFKVLLTGHCAALYLNDTLGWTLNAGSGGTAQDRFYFAVYQAKVKIRNIKLYAPALPV